MAASIINSDDGVVSGVTGIISSGGDDGTLELQTNGTTALTLDDSQDATFAGGITTTGVTSTGDVSVTGELKAESYNETYVALGTTGAVTVNCEAGNTFMCDATGDVTFTFSNPPASGTGYTMSIEFIQDSTARTITWPASVDWPAATAPTISTDSGAVDVFVFTTRDGGTTWYGFTAGQAIA